MRNSSKITRKKKRERKSLSINHTRKKIIGWVKNFKWRKNQSKKIKGSDTKNIRLKSRENRANEIAAKERKRFPSQ